MKHSKKYLCGFTAMTMALSIVPASGLLSLSDITVVHAADQQEIGTTADGYDYELWNQNYTGNASMTLGTNGGFSCEWSGIENCLFRTGKKLGSTKTYQEYGNISITYDVDYQPMGNSYMCVYGWTEDPTVEYYIVEAWGDWRPPGSNDSKGTVSSDGKSYDIYTSTRVNQPSIHGTETFEQYWSVNKTNPAKVNSMTNLTGTITVSDHFAAWEKTGMKMGKMYEVALNIEGYRSSGKAVVNKNDLQIGGTSSNPSDPSEPSNPSNPSNPGTSGSLMEEAKANFTPNVPADVKTGDKGTTTKISYYSKKAQKNKPANVWLPPNYSESKKYPVLYMNHGVMGGEDDLLTGWSIREMASNLIEKGEVQPFIIVFTQMYTNPNADRPSGINQEDMDRYDDFLYDLTESLMPYMSENYSVAEGRENTAIAGFSMGGRESLYIGMMACDKIGYVCASSPAPGIVPAQDMFLNHRGSMTEAEFGFKTAPYLLMIGGGTNDTVVGTFPKQYSELYTQKGQDHIWFEVQGGGHDASVGTPLFYNYFRNLFKAGSSSQIPSDPSTPPSDPTVSPTGTPPISGTGINADFESDTSGWTARGDGVKLLISTDMKHGGSSSLAVTGRTASWNGIQNTSSEIKAGGSYSLSAYAGYNNSSYSSAGFTFGVQYDLNGTTNYDNIADATASSGKWAELSGDFTVPAGAENIALYIQTTYSENDTAADLIDFFVDDIKITGGNGSSSDPSNPSDPADFTFGDINDDGKVDVTDLSYLAIHLANKTELTSKQKLAADVEYNGKVELADL
ncbi:MAG: glycoside hydrolase family 11 protein, partial [Oscillospiraceae bacterium]